LYSDSLNLLEYYGLVLPVRKVGPLKWERDELVTEVEGGTVRESYERDWWHAERFRGWKRGKWDSENVELADLSIPIPPIDKREYRFRDLRAMPWQVMESQAYESAHGSSIGTRVRSARDSTYTRTRFLRFQTGIWKPTSLEYWAFLGRGHSDARDPKKKRTLNFKSGLTAEEASDGNRDCECFYVVGEGYKSGTQRLASQGLIGYGRTQDAAVASLIGSIRHQVDLDMLLRLAESAQASKVNQRRKVLHEMSENLLWQNRFKELRLPNVRSSFYRVLVTYLCFHRLRRGGVSPNEAYARIAKAQKCTSDYVKKLVSQGGRAILVDTV
jgi:hypothetical protein